jgi:hypothetical protein
MHTDAGQAAGGYKGGRLEEVFLSLIKDNNK